MNRAYVRDWNGYRVVAETPNGRWIDVNQRYPGRVHAEKWIRDHGYTLVTQEEIEDEKPRAR